jgi:hypothetical protein
LNGQQKRHVFLFQSTIVIDFQDVFAELRSDLETEGRDLEWSMRHPSSGELFDYRLPHQLRTDVLFVPNEENTSNEEFLLDILPPSLLARSSPFRVTFFIQLKGSATPLIPEELEQLTILNYKMSVIQLHIQLWETYLQSGLGRLDRCCNLQRQDSGMKLQYWPTYLKELPVASGYSKTIPTNAPLDHQAHVESVKQYLFTLEGKHKAYSQQFDVFKNDMLHYTDGLAYQIEHFVLKEVLSGAILYFDMIIALLNHDYTDHCIQLQFFKEEPNEEQV